MHEIRDHLPLLLGQLRLKGGVLPSPEIALLAAINAANVAAAEPAVKWIDPQLAGTESDLKHPSAPKPEPVLDRSPVTLIVMNDGRAEHAIVTFSREMSAEDGRAMRLIVQRFGVQPIQKGDCFDFVHRDGEWRIVEYRRAPLPADDPRSKGQATTVSMSPGSIEAYRQLMADAFEAEAHKRGIKLPTASDLAVDTIKFRRIGVDFAHQEGDRSFGLQTGTIWRGDYQRPPATIDKSRLPKPRARRADYQQFEPLVVGEDVMLRSGATRLAGYCRAGKLVELTETHGVVALEGLRTHEDPLGPPTRLERYARSDLESIPF